VLGASRHGRWPKHVPSRLRDQVPVLQWDLAAPPSAETARQLAEFVPQAVYHLAALSVPADCGAQQPTPAAWAINVEGTSSLLNLVRGLPDRPRVLLASSCHVYAAVDPRQPRVNESAALAPAQGYGKTKLAAEQLVLEAVARGELQAVVARAFHHTGPRQSPRMIIPDWARQFVQGLDPVRVVCLDTFLDLSDVRDVVRGYRQLLLYGQVGAVYNVGSGQCRRSGDLFHALRQLCDPRRRVIELAPGRRQHPVADVSRMRTDTGWSPQVELTTTLADTLQYWREQAESP
jgi:GDP-4-dehydro-6-deoxy-D-mannose reductase